MNGMPLPLVLCLVSLLGLVAGTLGGLLGVGGSVIMIPGLVWLLGATAGAAPGEQHAFQAAAMVANVAVVEEEVAVEERVAVAAVEEAAAAEVLPMISW